jgi:DNA-binding NtrC family response regulator
MDATTASQNTIIVIDDDPSTLQFFVRLFERYAPTVQVVIARDGLRGLQAITDHHASLQLVLLDTRMPLLDGQTVAAFVRLHYPQVAILPVTGDPNVSEAYSTMGCRAVVVKGSSEKMYRTAIAEALSVRPGPAGNNALLRAMAQQAEVLLRNPGVVMDRSTVEKLHAHLAGMQGRFRSRELTQSVKILERAL